MARFNFTLTIGLANAEQREQVELSEEEIEAAEGEDREEKIHAIWTEWAWEHIDGSCSEIEEWV